MKTLQIIHEDQHLIVVNKPAGQLVIPGRGEDKAPLRPPGFEGQGKPLVDQVSSYIRKKAYVVHRIDRETSGLVAFAKDAKTHRELSMLWEGRPPSPDSGRKAREQAKASADSPLLFVSDEGRRVQKIYLAWVLGKMEKKQGLLDYPLRAFGSGRIGVDPKGKPSQTRFKVLKTQDGVSLLEVELLTGRRHQIRVHLYHAGHPILGDPLYGQERPVGGAPRLMLHAWRLLISFAGKELNLSCDTPTAFYP